MSESPCGSCPGLCCSFRRGMISFLGLEPGQRYDSRMIDYDTVDELVMEDGSLIDAEWFVVSYPDGKRNLSFECNHLTDEGDCGAYGNRPKMCRQFECSVLKAFNDDEEDEVPDPVEEMGRPEEQLEELDTRRVTDRVNEILARGVGQ